MSPDNALVSRVIEDFRLSWRELAIADALYKIAAFVLMTPLVALVLRLFVRVSGQHVLSDQDILLFFVGPWGWATLVVVGGASLGLVALAQANLMTVAFAATQVRRIDAWEGLLASVADLKRILLLTGRMVGRALLLSAPFLVAVGGIYLWLLTDYDINYYLTLKPSSFWLAVALASGLGLVLAVILVRWVVGWAFALQILLFERVAPAEALAESRRRTSAHRSTLTWWIVAWLVATTILAMLGNGLVGLLGRWLVPRLAGSLPLLAIVMGAGLLLWLAVSYVVSLVTAASFAILMVRLYRDLGDRGGARLDLETVRERRDRLPWVVGRFRKLLPWLLGGAVVASAAAGAFLISGIRSTDDAEITAHRGASGAAPENTLAAVELAIEQGTDWVEIDVQESADGVVVVAHDSDFKKVAGVGTKIWDATYEELAKIDIGGWFGPEFAGERVPTLAQVLDTCKGRAGLNIELKQYGHGQRLEERVIALVEERDMASEIVIMSLDYESVRRTKELRPDWTVGLLSAVALGDLTRLEVDFLAVSTRLATHRFVRSAHKAGKKVFVWTVNDVVGMSSKLDLGVDSLITDEPALARVVLEQRAGMTTAERLVAGLAAFLGGTSLEEMSVEDA